MNVLMFEYGISNIWARSVSNLHIYFHGFAQILRATRPQLAYSGSTPFEKKNDKLGPKSLIIIPSDPNSTPT
jgi:hypothetical protein